MPHSKWVRVENLLEQCNYIISTLYQVTFFDIVKNPHFAQALMIRSELISNLADKHPQLTATDVELAVKTIIDSIVNQLAQGNRIEIRGFGSFSVHTRPPRLARNPKTGEEVQVPEKAVLNFRAGIELRERVNVELVDKIAA